ncbi:MAG: hypothetical protein GX750_00485 [Clostridia bacterium]|nr:hypothetical protein [Clostridia bacterium]
MNKEALSYALAVLAGRRYTTAQLEQKLKKRHYAEDTIGKVLAYCQERRYLDDYEFARLWVEDRIRLKPMGRWRLKQELGRKGVPLNLIERVLDELLPEERELDLAKQLLEEQMIKRAKKEAVPCKVFNYLIRRGFSRQTICRGAQQLGLSICNHDQT